MFVVFSKDLGQGPTFLESIITPEAQDMHSRNSRPTIPDGQLHRIDMRIYHKPLNHDVEAENVPIFINQLDDQNPPISEFIIAVVDPVKMREILKAVSRHVQLHGGIHHVLDNGYMLAMSLGANQYCYNMILHFTAMEFTDNRPF